MCFQVSKTLNAKFTLQCIKFRAKYIIRFLGEAININSLLCVLCDKRLAKAS